MISSVFLMQPVGQALAQIVGVLVLIGQDNAHGLHDKQCGLDSLHEEECKKIIDGTWRIVIGSGAVPALLAIIFRFFLYDCGLYTLEVKNKPGNAFRDTQRVYGPPPATNGTTVSPTHGANFYENENMPRQFSLEDLHTYFIKDKNWHYLLGTAMTWFFLDVSFYGFSLDNRGILSDLWATTGRVHIGPELDCWNSTLPGGTSLVPGWKTDGLPTWQTDPTQPCNTIYETLIEQTKQYLLTVSLASIAGSASFIFFANRIPRRQWLVCSFMILTVLFLITGGVYYGVAHQPGAPATVVCVAICHFMFNFGKCPPHGFSPFFISFYFGFSFANVRYFQAPILSPSSFPPSCFRPATAAPASASRRRPASWAAWWPCWSSTALMRATRRRPARGSYSCSSPPSWRWAPSTPGPTSPTCSAWCTTGPTARRAWRRKTWRSWARGS